MSSWRSQVHAALFAAWTRAGLPDPTTGLVAYRAAVAGAPAPHDVPRHDAGPLDSAVVDRVHGFGVAAGRALADLLGLPPGPGTEAAVAWCGRFNLGISLLDHVCDESGRVDALEGLEPFRSLAAGTAPPDGSPAPATADPTPEERVVSRLAADLLAELAALRGLRDAVWRPLVAALYAAEVATARATYGDARTPEERRALLRTKSAGPFELMGVRLAGSTGTPADAHAGTGTATAAALGAAVGTLFWLADDAADLWLDLAHGAWNLFLVDVAEGDPDLLRAPASPFRDAAVGRRLEAAGAAARWADACVADLLAALPPDVPGPRQADGLAVVAAALSVWR